MDAGMGGGTDVAGAHERYQEQYYARDDRRRIVPRRTPYVLRHLDEALAELVWHPGARVLEIGAGLGRFTVLLRERGLDVVACDLSAELLASLRAEPGAAGIETIACDAATVATHTDERFPLVVGFFVLHHVDDLDAVFAGLADVLQPGGQLVLCEPNAFHLPYYLQITFGRGMTWRGDGGVRHMRAARVRAALKRAGFVQSRVRRYGFVPPVLANLAPGRLLERGLEGIPPLAPLRAFQVFSAWRA